MLIALVPDHITFTVKNDPALCWYLSLPTSRPVTLTVVDSRGIRPYSNKRFRRLFRPAYIAQGPGITGWSSRRRRPIGGS